MRKFTNWRKLNPSLRKIFISIFLLCSIAAHSLEIKSERVIEGFSWVLETTKGWQTITEVLSKEDGGDIQLRQGLNFKGILFRSFWYDLQIVRSHMNLGFDRKTHFLWTEKPDFNSEDMRYTEGLRCVDYSIQVMFPYRPIYSLTISPYMEYSFIEHSYDENFSGVELSTVMFNSIFAGIEFWHKISKRISQNLFFSYSPLVFENYSKSKMQFISYGFEIVADTHPVSLTLFLSNKKTFLQRGKLIFDGVNFQFTAFVTGFALHINLR